MLVICARASRNRKRSAEKRRGVGKGLSFIMTRLKEGSL